jgi:predicted nucleic acid-binding Zn ribbon protein
MRDDDESELDDDGDDASETCPCPYCRAPVYEDAERCPRCGNYLSSEEQPERQPRWFVVAALLCLAVALSWVFLG